MKMDAIPIPQELLEKIANYLATKPYAEVAPLLAALQMAVQQKGQSIQKPVTEKAKEAKEALQEKRKKK